MAIIAVAGGTSPTLGRSIVTAIARSSVNTPIILSRKPDGSKPTESHRYGAEVKYVDYNSVESLQTALEGVHTVICVLKVPGPEWATYQVNLLNAAKSTGTVKRFAPAEWGLGPLADGKVDLLGLKIVVWKACEESGLEVARFCTGGFMNYLALGDGRLDQVSAEKKEDILHGFVDVPMIWDVKEKKCELPVTETGTYPRVTLTDIADVGRFVAAACELPLGSWEQYMGICGETLVVDEVAAALEKSHGTTFAKTKVTPSQLLERAAAVEGIGSNYTEMVTKMLAQMEWTMAQDQEGLAIMQPTVNDLCPHVKPTSVAAFLAKIEN